IPPGAMGAVRRVAPLDERRAGWLLEPVHFHLAHDHVVLLTGADSDLDAAQSRALTDAIAPLLADEGWSLTVLAPRAWLLASPTPLQLASASADAAGGRNVEGYLPDGPDARRYRKLLNTIQMTWHAHPVNQQREDAG